MAWKNGGGSTRTVAVSPEGAGFDDFVWRVSIAEVEQSGGFSLFPGIDRTILLLDGAGMVLDGSDGVSHALTTAFEPYAFRGEDVIDARLVDGASRDFNVMVRRGRVSGRGSIMGSRRRNAVVGRGVALCARGDFEVMSGARRPGCPPIGHVASPLMARPCESFRKHPNAVLIGAFFESEEAAHEESEIDCRDSCRRGNQRFWRRMRRLPPQEPRAGAEAAGLRRCLR